MKKWLIRFGIFLGLLITLIVVTPFFVQVDRYRPQLEQAVNQRIRGQLQLGKLSLSLWGHIWVEVGGVKLVDSSKKEILSVNHAYFQLPFSSIFSGSPDLIFKMDQPEIHLARDPQGKFNVMSLVPAAEGVPATAPTAPANSPAKTADATQSVALPALALQSRLGIELKNALLTYDDRKSDLKTEIRDFNLKLEDLSMSHPVKLTVWTDLNTKMGKTLSLQGPIRLDGKAQPLFEGSTFKSLTLEAALKADDLEIQVPDTFQKKRGVPARGNLALTVLPDEVQIQEFKAQFVNAELTTKGTVKGLGAATGPQLDFNIATNEIQFKPWVELVPALAQFDLGGAAQLSAQFKGSSEKPAYEASFAVKDLSAKAPMLKVQPRWNGKVHVKTDQIDSILVTMAAPGSQVELTGSVVGFKKPHVSLSLNAEQIDVDQLVDLSSSSTSAPVASAAKEGVSQGEKSPAKQIPAVNYDAQVAELRKMPMVGDIDGQFSIKIGKFKAKQIQISQIGCKLGFKNWVASMDQCGLRVFQGDIQSKLSLNLSAAMPSYQGFLDVKGLDFAQAGEAGSPMFKNTMKGRGQFRMDLQGASFNVEAAKSNLKAKGNLKVQPAEFSTLDIMKMVKAAVDQAMVKIGDKVPQLKGKGMGNLPSHSGGFDEVTSDFTIENAKFSAPNFVAKGQQGKNFDLKGKTVVGLKDYSLDAFWELTDTYNLTHLRDISIDQAGVKIAPVFADGSAPVHFPLHVGCTLINPCYSSTEIPEALTKVALSNIGKAVSGKAKSELIKRAGQLLNNVPPGVSDAIQNKFKGLFR